MTDPKFNVFVDESSQNAHNYMVLGGVIVNFERSKQLAHEIQKIGAGVERQFKWSRVTRLKLPVYTELIDWFFEQNRKDYIHFHAVIINCHHIDHHAHNDGDSELGFSKFLYQLLLHKFGRRYTPTRIYCYLDFRTTNQNTTELQDVLNNGLSRHWGIENRPFRRVQFQKSSVTPLLQLSDILIGAIAYHKNNRHIDAGASAHKRALAQQVANAMGQTTLGKTTPFSRKRFTIWNIQLQRGSQGPR